MIRGQGGKSMTIFYFGILAGFFLGAIFMFVVLGMIHPAIKERQEKSALAGGRAAREIHDDREALSYSTTKGLQIPPMLGPGGTGGLHD
jgi:hypothetical protein